MQTKSLQDLPIDVVMPVWAIDDETMVLTKNAIESLRVVPIRLILIDNGSMIGGGLMRQWADVYIRNKENLGYAKAVNQGLQLAGDIVAVANNDIQVSSNWKETALVLLNREMVGSVHFRMIPYEQPFSPGTETWLTGKERWCSSSFFVMRNIQYYDEQFLNSLDDWDYWRRFRQLGHITAYTNRAEYQHMNSWSQQKRPDRAKYDEENLKKYIDKWGEHPDSWMERMYPEQLKLPYLPFP